MAIVNPASAIATGLQGLGTPSSRAEARARKAKSDEELEKLNIRKEEGVTRQEVDKLKSENQKIINENARTKTNDAWRAFNADGNPKHLNRALQDPVIKNLFPDVVTIDRIDVKNDKDLITKSGIEASIFDDPDIGPNALGRFVKVTNTDGTKTIEDTHTLQIATGYADTLNDQALEEMKTRSEITKNIAKADGKGGLTNDQKNAAAWAPIKAKKANGEELDPAEQAFDALMIDKTQGNIAGRLGEVEQTTTDMLKQVGGDEGWQNLDLTDRKTRNNVRPFIEKMEKLGDLELNRDDRKTISYVNRLLALGEPAAKLTADEAGLIDNMWFRMKKYAPGTVTKEDMTAIQASSGYAAFQNELRKVLYGSVLTPGEIQKFNDAYGTLKQQFPEVMSQFGTMLNGLQADIESVSNFNNPYVVEYRLGDTPERIDNLIDNVDKILDRIVTDTATVQKTQLTEDTQGKLDGIFKQ